MENKAAILLIMLTLCGFISAWEIEDVNGSFVDSEGMLKADTVTRQFSWGKGLRIPNGTLEIDLEDETLYIPWLGKSFISEVYKDEQDSINLKVFDIVDITRNDPLSIKVTFIDRNKAYIVCNKWERWSAGCFSPEAQWVWHRLSGPKKN